MALAADVCVAFSLPELTDSAPLRRLDLDRQDPSRQQRLYQRAARLFGSESLLRIPPASEGEETYLNRSFR